MSKVARLGGRGIKKSKLLGSIQQVVTAFLEFFYQNWFILCVLGRICELNDILQAQIFKMHFYIYKNPRFFKKLPF